MRARGLRAASTDAEQQLWNALRNRQLAGHKFRRQHPIGPYFADFACVEAGLVVEIDGSQHFEPDALASDRLRTTFIERAGFTVLRFDSRQALLEREAMLAVILERLSAGPHLQCALRLASRSRSTGSPHAARKPRLAPNPLPHAGEGAKPSNPLPRTGEAAHSSEHPA